MKTISKIIRELEKITTEKEWQEVFLAANFVHDNFRKEQLKMQKNIKKAEEKQKNEALKAQWKIGDRVEFVAQKDKSRNMGIIIKRNPKRAKIQVYVGIKGLWNVPYAYLTRITDKQDIILLTVGKLQA